MNVPRGGRQLIASLASARQSYANLARIWGVAPPPPARETPAPHMRLVA